MQLPLPLLRPAASPEPLSCIWKEWPAPAPKAPPVSDGSAPEPEGTHFPPRTHEVPETQKENLQFLAAVFGSVPHPSERFSLPERTPPHSGQKGTPPFSVFHSSPALLHKLSPVPSPDLALRLSFRQALDSSLSLRSLLPTPGSAWPVSPRQNTRFREQVSFCPEPCTSHPGNQNRPGFPL